LKQKVRDKNLINGWQEIFSVVLPGPDGVFNACTEFEFSFFLCYYQNRDSKPRRLEETGVSNKKPSWLFYFPEKEIRLTK